MKLVLTDVLSQASLRFVASLERAEIPFVQVNATYNGFLPKGVLNPLASMIGAENLPEKALHYNQIPVPAYHEIKNINGVYAEILRGDRVMGRIYYAQGTNRLVQEVTWLSRTGILTLTELYNRQGFKYADILFNTEGKAVKKIYYHAQGQPVMTEDLVFHTFKVKDKLFPNVTAFIVDYIKNLNIVFDEILINSMAVPFFTVNRLKAYPASLYFQEVIQEEIPGNMQQILRGESAVQRIFFENEAELTKVKEKTQTIEAELFYLGAIEKIRRRGSAQKRILTFTRSDQILDDEKLADQLKDFSWTIAAPTEVSDKLRTFGNDHENVAVIETVPASDVKNLLQGHDVYLDVNQGEDSYNVIQEAYLDGMLVLAHQQVAKNPDYALVLENQEEIVNLLRSSERAKWLRQLHEKKGKAAEVQDYIKVFGSSETKRKKKK